MSPCQRLDYFDLVQKASFAFAMWTTIMSRVSLVLYLFSTTILLLSIIPWPAFTGSRDERKLLASCFDEKKWTLIDDNN